VLVRTPAPTFRGRLWRWTKRLAILSTLLVVAAGPAVYLGLPVLSRQYWVLIRVEKALTRAMGTPVMVSDMAWSWEEGLVLREVSASMEIMGTSVEINSIRLQPRFSKLLRGKLQFRAIVEKPEISMDGDWPEPRQFQLPRFGKNGMRIESIEIRNGIYTCRNARIDGITAEGTGRLENRTVRLDLSSLSGSFNGVAVEGTGILRLTQEGFSGQIDANEPPGLRDALRPAHLVIKKAPVLSEPF
jgi:hypothetical protein